MQSYNIFLKAQKKHYTNSYFSQLKIYRQKSLFCGNFILGFLQNFLRKIDENWG